MTELPYRAELAKVTSEIGAATSMQVVFEDLTGPRLLWWHCCQEAVRDEPDWLESAAAEDVRAFVNGQASGAMPVADPAYVVARSLAQADVPALTELVGRWSGTRLLLDRTPPGQGLYADGVLSTVELRLRDRLVELFGAVAAVRKNDPAAVSMVALTALLLVGLELRDRPVVRVSVVFARPAGQEQGVSGVLELREFPAGPAGLYPDPRAMAGARSPGTEFRESLSHAWQATPWPGTGRCVLWRIVLSDEPGRPPEIDGGSLGAAFALGLRELFQRPGRVSLRGLFYSLRPHTAVTGILRGGERLDAVSGMEAKLHVVRRKGWRLVAPEPNRRDVPAADLPLVRFAETLAQADKHVRQWRTGRLVVATVLVVALVVSGVLFSRYDAANDRERTAAELAAVSVSLKETNVDLAQLFAVQAYRRNPNPQSRAALFQAVTTSPYLVRTLQTDGQVAATTASADGRTVVAATQTGNVHRWTLPDRAGQIVMRLPGSVDKVAASRSGDTVAAIGSGVVQVWSAKPGTGELRVPKIQQPKAIGVSPSGRFVAVVGKTDRWGVPPTLQLLDRTTGNITQTQLVSYMSSSPDSVVFPDDSTVQLFDGGGYGVWERLAVPELTRRSGKSFGFGVHNKGSAISVDGRYVSYTNGAPKLPLWTTEETSDIDAPNLIARIRPEPSAALAISSDASSVAQAIDKTLYVSATTQPTQEPTEPIALAAGGPVVPGSVAFLGTSRTALLSASGQAVTLWDLRQYSRIAEYAQLDVPSSCNGCVGPYIGLQQGKPGVAVVPGDRTSLSARTPDSRNLAVQSPTKSYVSPPFWLPDTDQVLLINEDDASASIRAVRPGLPEVGTWPPAPNATRTPDGVALIQLTPDRKHVFELRNSGAVWIRLMTGPVIRQFDGPPSMAPTSNGSSPLGQGYAAADAQSAHTAVIDTSGEFLQTGPRKVHVFTVEHGTTQTIEGEDIAGVAFADGHLLIQRRSGELEIWHADGSARTGSIRGLANTVVGPVSDGDRAIVEISADGTAHVIDYPSGTLVGVLPHPIGIKGVSTSLAFSTDGNRLVSVTEAGYGNTPGWLVDWKMSPDSWIQAACESVGRDLTADEWSRHMKSAVPSDLRCQG
jgi:WD40 repeat protein